MPAIFSKDYDPLLPGWEPANFDAIEIHGVRDFETGERGETCCEVDDTNPQFYSVYIHNKPERFMGVECVGDFSDPADAIDYAIELAIKYNWPITYLLKSGVDPLLVEKARPFFGDPPKNMNHVVGVRQPDGSVLKIHVHGASDLYAAVNTVLLTEKCPRSCIVIEAKNN